MPFEVGSIVARKVAMWTIVRFLPVVNEDVSLQTKTCTKCLVTLLANIILDPRVRPLVIFQVT